MGAICKFFAIMKPLFQVKMRDTMSARTLSACSLQTEKTSLFHSISYDQTYDVFGVRFCKGSLQNSNMHGLVLSTVVRSQADLARMLLCFRLREEKGSTLGTLLITLVSGIWQRSLERSTQRYPSNNQKASDPSK